MAIVHHYTGRAILLSFRTERPMLTSAAVVALLSLEDNLSELTVKPRGVRAVVLLEDVDNIADRRDELAAMVSRFALKGEVVTDLIDDPAQ